MAVPVLQNTVSSQITIDGGRPPAIQGSSAENDGSERGLSIDEVCHLLQNERRRNVLEYLRRTEDQVEMREIAEEVAAEENDTSVDQLHHDDRKRVYIALYQVHLPKMDDSGIIEYDQDRGTVRKTAAANQVYRAMDAVNGKEPEPSANDWERPGLNWPLVSVAVVSGVVVALVAGLSLGLYELVLAVLIASALYVVSKPRRSYRWITTIIAGNSTNRDPIS